MLDLRILREHPDEAKQKLARMKVTPGEIDHLLELDVQVRRCKTEAETLRAQMNAASKELAKAQPEERDAKRLALRSMGDSIKKLDDERQDSEESLNQILLTLPNFPDDRVPEGSSDADNQQIRAGGVLREFSFTCRPHWELGKSLGIIDFDRGIKISGSRFYVLQGAGAALQRALIAFMLDMHTVQHGYTEIYPPFMVKQECLTGTGQLPKFADNLYHDAEEDYWLVPTAEVPVTNLHRDEILEKAMLPLHYVAYTPCFRRERMSAGKDVRGIKRGHQFDKVEMVRICSPETSDAELESLTANAESVCTALGLAWRTMLVCTGEKGDFNAIQYDIEVFAPAAKGDEGGEWLEVSSCSNFRDFQARRAGIRYRPAAGAKPELVHTLNGSGLALPRVMIAILENYQNEDGSVTIPEPLRPYMHGKTRLEPQK